MSVTHGADVEALRAGARELADVAQTVLAVNVRLTHRVHDVGWNGPAAARFRAAWEAEHSPVLSALAGVLNRAAADVLGQAADQERASSPTGRPSPATDALQARLNTQRDVLGLLADGAQVVRAMAAHPDAVAGFATFNRAWELAEDFAGPLETAGGRLLGVLGTVVGAHELVKGAAEGDATAVVQNAVPLGITALVSRGVVAGGPGAAVSVAWTGGSMLGNEINAAMEGTRYGDRVTENFDAVFDAVGPAGMLLTPFVLAASGLDLLADEDGPPIP